MRVVVTLLLPTCLRATRPLFFATHAIAKLYSNDALPARLIMLSPIVPCFSKMGHLSLI